MYGARAPPARRPVGWFSYTFLKFQDIDFNRPLPKKRQLLLQLPFLWGPAARRAATPFGILMLRAAKPPLRQDFRLWRKCLYGAKTPPAKRPPQTQRPFIFALLTVKPLYFSLPKRLGMIVRCPDLPIPHSPCNPLWPAPVSVMLFRSSLTDPRPGDLSFSPQVISFFNQRLAYANLWFPADA